MSQTAPMARWIANNDLRDLMHLPVAQYGFNTKSVYIEERFDISSGFALQHILYNFEESSHIVSAAKYHTRYIEYWQLIGVKI